MDTPWKFWSALAVVLVALYLLFDYVSPARDLPARSPEVASRVDEDEEEGSSEARPVASRAEESMPSDDAPEADSFAESGSGIPVQEAASRIQASRPSVVVLFSPGCPLSRAAFPELVTLARAHAGRAEVLAFSTDAEWADVEHFLYANQAPFRAELLQEWQPGELSAAMGSVGIDVGAQWTKPLIAVVGADGKIVGQWQGITDLRPVEEALQGLAL